MLNTIIINTKELTRSFWESTYSFIKSCVNSEAPDESYCMTYAVSFPNMERMRPGSILRFWIRYQKDNYKEDFSDMVPFFMITRGPKKHLATLAIDFEKIQNTDIAEQNSYIFKCSEFFRFMDARDNESHMICFVNEKDVDKKTGNLWNKSRNGLTHLRTKTSNDPASRKYLPLIEINPASFGVLFENQTDSEEVSDKADYIKDAIQKISNEIECEVESSSLFDEWFVKSFFYYLEDAYKEIDYTALADVLHIYSSNIYELVQNIIFHTTAKTGLMYFVFNRASDLTEEQKQELTILDQDDNPMHRFLTFGIFDFNEEGITESFQRKYDGSAELELEDFFSPRVLPTKDLTHLDLRRMAHIGLPVLMSTIRDYHGYFRVESNRHSKKTVVELKDGQIISLKDREYVNGTHYEIMLPIVPSREHKSSEWSLHQKSSILNRLVHYKKSGIPTIPLLKDFGVMFSDDHPMDKEEQMGMIESVGRRILEACGDSQALTIDCDGYTGHPSLIIKLISFLQSEEVYHPVIILSSLSDEMMNLLCSTVKTLLIDSRIRPIWSTNSAVILISKGLRYQVITGSTPDDLYAINADYQTYYYSRENYFEQSGKAVPTTQKQDRFILPYELLTGDHQDRYSLFYSYVRNLLKRPIDDETMGYCLNQYTYIGNKLIVECFYEADSLFQNSFYTDRFAYIVAERIVNNVKVESGLVILGYKFYSEQLIKTVAKYLKETYEIKSDVYIADEDKSGQLFINVPLKDVDSLRSGQFVTIVPIGATLSTNDKLIAAIKKQFGDKVNVVYNHCAIVVRDIEDNEEPTVFEKDQKWDSIDFENQVVKTRFENAKEIHYDILLGALKKEESNWIRRPNSRVSLPDSFQEEQYVNPSENSSINSQNLLGLPSFDSELALGASYDHTEELKRLLDLMENTYSGHIENNGLHFRYYFDTESYLRRSTPMFNSWLDKVAKSSAFDLSRFNIIICPNARIESDLVNLVNEKVFGGNALILLLDVNNWKNNAISKFSYVSKLVHEKGRDIHFHFVDHSLFTATTYKRSKSFLNALCKGIAFQSGIVVINRLNYDLREEIRQDFDGELFVYFNLFVPESNDSGRNCSQCDLDHYYKQLLNNTALSSCREIIGKNQEKLKLTTLTKLKQAGRPISKWRFLRLFFAHEIAFRVSMLKQDNLLKQTLDPLYKQLFEDKTSITDEGLRLLNQLYDDQESLYDKRISFLKALSSPPLSRYIPLRKYAHSLLLKTLKACLDTKENNCQYDDFRLLKAVLKSLSFFQSNAVIRKDVILGSWRLQEWIVKKMEDERESTPESYLYQIAREEIDRRLEKLNQFGEYYQFYIKNAVFESGSKSSYLGELLRTGKEKREYPLKVSKTLSKDDNSLLKEYPDNPQFQSFLLAVFYDNTTITRKTLLDFEKEILRDDKLKGYYFDTEKGGVLRPFSSFVMCLSTIRDILTEKVHSGYYYSNFEPYLLNEDSIHFVEKFACLIFLKFKFEHIRKAKQQFSIETEIQEILQGFNLIMEAQTTEYSVGDRDGVYFIDTRKAKGELVPYDSYINRLYSNIKTLPDIVLNSDFALSENDHERKIWDVRNASSVIINKGMDNWRDQALSFFYPGNYTGDLLRLFTVRQREAFRLLLLLREEMNTFFVDFLLKERVTDLWIEKNDNHIKFNKIYQSSSHVFNPSFEEMIRIESMDEPNITNLARVWFWISNEIISYLYANIETSIDEVNRHFLNVDRNILNEKDTFQDVFDNSFVTILKALLTERWSRAIGNRITINGCDIESGGWFLPNPKARIHCRKQILQTFLVQCLNNSLATKSKTGSRGHRGLDEVKTVNIEITENTIKLEDGVSMEYYSECDKRKRKERFQYKAERIREMNCKRYSSTTLTSIQGFTEYMRRNAYGYKFDFGFNESLNFYVTLTIENNNL